MKVLRIGISGIALVSLIGCNSLGLGSKRIDYGSGATQAPSLEVPPDLTTPGSDERFRVPQGESESVATYSDYSKGGAVQSRGASAILPKVKGVRLERNGTQRWLVVKDKPENVWFVIKAFLQETGLPIKSEDQAAGVLETEWSENRANIPQGGVRAIVGKVLDSAYSSGERDQYRVRLERSKDDESTEVYITHRGMEEVLSDDQNTSKWQARPNDPEMEAIMLQRLMARFGGSEAKADGTVATTTEHAATDSPTTDSASGPAGAATLEDIFDGSKIIVINDAFDRAWRRTGLAIERAGLTIEDKDRVNGIYFLRTAKTEKGWIDKLMFWKDDADTTRRYRVNIKDGGSKCEVTVTDQDGANNETSGRILEAIYKNINE